MRKSTISRREMLGGTVYLAVIGAMPIALSACTTPKFRCGNVSGLSEGDLELRSALEYQDGSATELLELRVLQSRQGEPMWRMHAGEGSDSSAGVLQLLGSEGLSL